jgi:predicted dehydrogenase
MNELRVCLIGAGALSTRRIYPYLGAAGAVLAGACDLDAGKAEQNARRFGGQAYTDHRRMLAEQKPDAVIICIGPEQHAALAREILKLGFPVYTEKPPAPSAAAALEVARAARDAGQLCTTAFKKRYCVAYSRAKEWLARFPAEEVLSLSLDYASGAYRNADARSSFLLDFGIHAIDLVGYLGGDVAEVFAFAKGREAYAVSLRFASGAVGSLNLNAGRSFGIPTEEMELTVRGGSFMTIHNSSCWRITEREKCVEWREPPTFTSAGDSGNETGHLAEIVDFLAAVREKRTTRSNVYESYKSMVLYEAIRDAAESGRVVPVKVEAL